MKNESWSKEEVVMKLKEKMQTATDAVWEIAEREKTTLRSAAYMLALQRIQDATIDT